MEYSVKEKLFSFLDVFKNTEELKELKSLTKKIQDNSLLLDKISKLQKMEKYDSSYLPLKSEILNDKDYKRYIELTHELQILTMEFSKDLKNLIREDGSSCG